MDVAARRGYVQLTDGTDSQTLHTENTTIGTSIGGVLLTRSTAGTAVSPTAIPTNTDNVAAGYNALATASHLYAFDGTTFDRLDQINSGQLKVTHHDTAGNAMPSGDNAARPIWTVATHEEIFDINLDAQAIVANTGFMIIDLSNTAVWPHTNTSVIHIDCISININGDAAYRGDIYIGFLSSVDAANGDLNIIKTWHMDQDVTNLQEHIHLAPPIICNTTNWFGRTVANDTLWQTDVNLQGPNDAVSPATQSYPPGDGDLVLWIARTAGTVDVNINIRYHTE